MVEVTVIIPCFNCARWIGRCLNALEQQTYRDFEVICIDDCSTDDTYEILCRYMKKVHFPLLIVRNLVNCGPAISRNTGIKRASGRLLSFCDSDDWYDRTYLEEMHSTLTAEDADLVMCEYRKVYEHNNRVSDVHYLKDYSGNKEDLLAYSKAAMWLLMFKKELARDLDIPNLLNGEDIAYVPCIESRAQKISIVKKVLYNYYIRQGSVSKSTSSSVYISLLEAFEFIKQNYINADLEVIEYLGIKTILYGAVLNACKSGENKNQIIEIIYSFEKLYPTWANNKYLLLFNKQKMIFLTAVKHKRIMLCKIYARVHQLVSK